MWTAMLPDRYNLVDVWMLLSHVHVDMSSSVASVEYWVE